MENKLDCSLYLVTDRSLLNGRSLSFVVEQAILGGVTLVQLREKNISSRQFFLEAAELLKVTRKYKVPLIINDRIDIALAVEADGVHLGQKDIPANIARKLMPKNMLLGVSAATVEEAIEAQHAGADYIGCGAIYTTATKQDTRPVSIDTLTEIKKSIVLPVAAIGGIDRNNAPHLRMTEIDGIAVVSAILAHEDIRAAALAMRESFIV